MFRNQNRRRMFLAAADSCRKGVSADDERPGSEVRGVFIPAAIGC
jgi:hypothetical protein